MEDREIKLSNGYLYLFGSLGGLILAVILLIVAAEKENYLLLLLAIVLGIGSFISLFGLMINNPNQTRVIQLFGQYRGTLRDVGFFWGNPFYWTTMVSLRVRTFETGIDSTEEVKDATGKVIAPAKQTRRPSKVNDLDGTPIEIESVVVWRVVSPALAVFNVDKYEEFVQKQSEAALRNLASKYRYDTDDESEYSLRGNIDEIAEQLRSEVQGRMEQAGIEILEARISYLAYAPEIASAMLQRQQARAVIAARQQIVDGAVGMVEHALNELKSKGLVDLDNDRQAALVGNLLVVLCGHTAPQPVLNTGQRG